MAGFSVAEKQLLKAVEIVLLYQLRTWAKICVGVIKTSAMVSDIFCYFDALFFYLPL